MKREMCDHLAEVRAKLTGYVVYRAGSLPSMTQDMVTCGRRWFVY
jgi:hypothetical protein